MPFWSGKTIKDKLATVIVDGDAKLIDCAAYTMRVGKEYYVTPTDDSSDANSHSLKTLADGDSFAIPPGQFAHVITHETVKIPKGMLAFISVRTTIKWKGLINVSGFHVDPGYQGRLTFSVYNAGPASIHLRSGDPVFLIWFASLDEETDYAKIPKDTVPPEYSRINITGLAPISGELHSLNGLASRLKNTEKALTDRITALEKASGLYQAAAGAVIAICIGLLVKVASDWGHPEPKSPAVTFVSAPATPAGQPPLNPNVQITAPNQAAPKPTAPPPGLAQTPTSPAGASPAPPPGAAQTPPPSAGMPPAPHQ